MKQVIKIPSLGDAENTEVIEICVNPGDSVGSEDSIVVLESEKAAMDVPASKNGVVKKVLVKIGDEVKEGDDFLEIEITEEEMLDAIAFGHKAIKDQIKAQVTLANAVGKKEVRSYEEEEKDESLEKEIQSLREFVVQQGHLPLELQEAMGKNRKSNAQSYNNEFTTTAITTTINLYLHVNLVATFWKNYLVWNSITKINL